MSVDLALEEQKALIRLLNAEAQVAESVALDFSGLGWIDPRDYGIGDQAGFLPGPGMAVGLQFMQRQKRGEFIPAFLNEHQLDWYRKRIRALVVNNEIALNAINQRVNYALGTGLKYTAVAGRTGATPGETNSIEADVIAAQEVIDAFCELNDLPDREAESLARVDTDGEAFIRLFPDTDTGLIELRFVEPEHVRSPTGAFDENSFGVRTKKNDVETVEGYWLVEGMPDDGARPEYVDASEVIHLKHPETPSTSKRGLSSFFPIETTLRAAEDLVTSTVSIAKARAKIAWIERLSGSTKAIAQALTANRTAATATDPQTGETVNMERIRQGTVIRTGQGHEFEFPAANIAASDHVTVLQMVLRIIAARFSMPEYLLSADASNANYSSTLVAESPFVKAMERLQDFVGRYWGKSRYVRRRSVVWRQLAFAIDLGVLPRSVFRNVKVQVDGPTLVVRDKAQEASTNKTYLDMGVKSHQTIQSELGLDSDTETANFTEYRDKMAGPQTSGPSGLRETVGGLQAIQAVQMAFYAGQIPQEAAIANMELMFGFNREEAMRLVPDVPVKQAQGTTPGDQEQPPVPPQGEMGGEVTPEMAAEVRSFLADLAAESGLPAPEIPDEAIAQALQAGLSEACVGNASGKGFHDDQTGHPCTQGGGDDGGEKPSSGSGDDASVDKTEKAAQGLLSKLGGKVTALPGKVKAWAVNKYRDLESKYGKAGAMVILGATVAIVAAPLPGTALAAPLPELVAKVVVMVSNKVRGKAATQDTSKAGSGDATQAAK